MTQQNKTLANNIVKRSQGFGTDAYHALVVVNERDGGRKLEQTVPPEGKFRPPWFPGGTLVAYHVTLDERLRYGFGCKLLHGDGVHSFKLQFDVSYRVLRDGVHLPVMRLEADPLGSIEEEIKRVLTPPLRVFDWAMIEAQLDMTPHSVWAKGVDDGGEVIGNMERIQLYGRTFGIDVRQITVTRHLDDLEVVRTEIDLHKQTRLRDYRIRGIHDALREDEAKQTVEHKLATTGALHGAHTHTAKSIEAFAAGTGDAVRGIASSATSISEVASNIRQVKQVIDAAHAIIPNVAGGSEGVVRWVPLMPPSDAPQLEAGPPTREAPERNANDVLMRAHEVAAALPVRESERNRFLAAVLRLQAARMEGADDATIETHRAALAELHRAHAQEMRDDHSSFIADLIRPRRPTR